MWSWSRCKSWCRGTRRTRCHRETAWRRPCSRNGRGRLPRRVREVDEQLLYMRSTSQWSQTADQSTAGFVFRSLNDEEYSSSTCYRVKSLGFNRFLRPELLFPWTDPIISSFISWSWNPLGNRIVGPLGRRLNSQMSRTKRFTASISRWTRILYRRYVRL